MMPAILTVGPTQAVHCLVWLSSLKCMTKCSRGFRKVFRMEEFFPAEIQKVFVTHPGVVENSLIETGRLAVWSCRPQHGRHRFDDLSELQLTFTHCFLGALAFRYIEA